MTHQPPAYFSARIFLPSPAFRGELPALLEDGAKRRAIFLGYHLAAASINDSAYSCKG
jgi:hypothetical protein